MEGVTRKSVNLTIISLVLILVLLSVTVPFTQSKPAHADFPPSILKWSFVDTPTIDNFVVVGQSEINRIAFGPDDQVMYVVDVANSPNSTVPFITPTGRCLYKSTDKGLTWDDITNRLPATSLPVWDIAVSSEDANFLVAVTDRIDDPPTVQGPQAVFVSTDGGQNWQPSIWTDTLRNNEYISCVAISPQYDIDKRYIAVATRDVTLVNVGNGRVFTLKSPGPSGWMDQTNALSPNWVKNGDVVALKFSPSYALDSTIVVVFASQDILPATGGLFLNIGYHDVIANRTTWKNGLGYPVRIRASDNRSPNYQQIITADLELPFDFNGSDPGALRRSFVSFDACTGIAPPVTYFSGVYRIDNITVYQLMYKIAVSPPAVPDQRISSIAYYGTYASGKLIAGETTTEANRGTVDIWLCSDPFALVVPPGWRISDAMKSPTGGVLTRRANALVHWDARGDKVYCGTSSASLTMGGTSLLTNSQWPGGLSNYPVPPPPPPPPVFDESAFSVSLDNGETWNQLSLIDTKIDQLADVAVIEAPEDSNDYSVLYLASINISAATNFDSIWRSISDPLGLRWERVLCMPHVNNNLILRVNPRISDDNVRSRVIVYAYLDALVADYIRYSANEGQYWQILYPGIAITDFTLASDAVIYILSDISVMRGVREASVWKWGVREPTGLTTGHTITTPLKNPPGRRGTIEDWVIVGSRDVGEVAWADFSKVPVKFLPPVDERRRTPVPGHVHVLADEQFESNRTIYVAIGNADNGRIYRWTIDKSTAWEELPPRNSNFYGLVQRRGVLYGAYNVPAPPRGVYRTLYPRAPVPPPPEWDDLTANLPGTVSFNCEPSSLRISGRADNNLWAIDGTVANFNLGAKTGCLWVYTDTLAKSGPWTTAPASEDVIPVDPVTGRANEVNFAWRSLSYANGYELQIAKDQDFFMRILVNANIVPPDQVSPAWIQFPGLLEAGHKYFWRVRASRASTGEEIHSPWSAIMNFTAMAGFPVQAKHLGPTLLQPPNPCTICNPLPAFSWSPMFQTTKYQFILARDAALTQVVHEAEVTTTAYEYKGTLEKGTYFWQVKAIKPMLSEPSPVGCFIVTGPEKTTSVLGVEISESLSLVITIGIALYTIFVAVMLVWIMRTRYRGE